MNEQQILDLLINANICNGNISATVLPESTPLPYGRYSATDRPFAPDLVTSDVNQIRFNLSIWDKDYNTLYALKNQIRNIFKTQGEEIFSNIGLEEQTGYQRLETNWYFIETI